MHKDKTFCFNYCQYKNKRKETKQDRRQNKKKCEELLKKKICQKHTHTNAFKFTLCYRLHIMYPDKQCHLIQLKD